MGRSIQFESRHVELWGIYEMERDDDVLEFYDQPTRIQLQYRARSGRKTTQWHTPDFFVIRQSSAGFEEQALRRACLGSHQALPRSDEVPAEITIDLTQLRPLDEYR